MKNTLKIILFIALASVSAILVFSCGSKEATPTVSDPDKVPTQISYNHKILSSKNGQKSYRFETPLLERYELAKEPFMEFRQGIKIETFAEDSTSEVESNLVANYAHFNEVTQIWEASGNVIARNIKGEKWLFTELLFWDQNKKIIYTHEKAKVIDGKSVHYGKGFEADDSFEEWSFNNTRGQIEVQEGDTTATDSTANTLQTESPTTTINTENPTPRRRRNPMDNFYEQQDAQYRSQSEGSERMEEDLRKRRQMDMERRKREDNRP